MKIYRYIFFILLFFSVVLPSNINTKPVSLLNSLHNNDDWEIIKFDNDISISTKRILDKNLLGVMVEKELSLPKEILQNVIMDINNYSNFLKGSSYFISKELKKTSEFVEGYQFIPINIPFFDNREYLFRMYPNGFKDGDNTSIIHWYLLDKDVKYLERDNQIAIYLSHGAGLWVAEKKSNDKTQFSYRIYMDPGGSLPSFLIDLINKTSVVNIFRDAISEAQKRYEYSN